VSLDSTDVSADDVSYSNKCTQVFRLMILVVVQVHLHDIGDSRGSIDGGNVTPKVVRIPMSVWRGGPTLTKPGRAGIRNEKVVIRCQLTCAPSEPSQLLYITQWS